MTLDLKSRLETAAMERQGKKAGSEILFLCPAHDDHHPSARYNPDKGVWTCDVCQAGGGNKNLAERLGIEVEARKNGHKETIATYDYGEFQVIRTRDKNGKKGFFQRRPDGQGGWLPNLKGIKTSLYHQDELPAAISDGKPIFVVEGEKDVDRLRELGQVATCNPMGAGKWRIHYCDALEGADLVIIPDNDDPGRAHATTVRDICYGKAARIRTLYLPDLKDKGDVSDWLDAGNTIDQLQELLSKVKEHKAETVPRSVAKFISQYDNVDGMLCWLKPNTNDVDSIPLCNFSARVTEDITRDNGKELSRFFKLCGSLPGGRNLPDIEVPSAGFNGLNWVTDKWGMQAVIAAGNSSKDRLREAIQLQSANARQRTIYTHTGWREIDGEIYFLSGSGAMGRDDIEVELEDDLKGYQLLPPTGDAVEAIKKSLDFYLVAPPETSMPIWATMYLAPLTEFIDTSFTLWVVGGSGSFKSTLTSLALCHFGTFDDRKLPAAWRSTQNTLEKQMFTCKDIPLCIDDWAPGQDNSKASELERKAEHIVRAQGNRQGRSRMNSDTSLKSGYKPQGILVTSGEQLPSGHSHTARIFSVDIEGEDVDTVYLSTAQLEHTYSYCKAMSFYIDWLKKRYQDLKDTMPQRWRDYRDKAWDGQSHRRMSEVVAGLTCAVELATEFACEYGAMTDSEAKAFRETAWETFCTLAARQSDRTEKERPARRAIELLRAMIDQGTAVLVNKDNTMPTPPAPGTHQIGWYDNNNGSSAYYLNPLAAYQAIVDFSQRSRQPFTIKAEALWKDMKRMGYSECDSGRVTSTTYIFGKTMRVIKLNKTLTPSPRGAV